jgi:predicted CoA-binding protein
VPTMSEATADFLAHKRIAVAGVARKSGEHGGNIVYQRLRSRGYEVYAVNPSAEQVEGDPCYPNLAAIPGGVDGVVIATAPDVTEEVVAECAALGIRRVWIHQGPVAGSCSDAAVELGKKWGLDVIPSGCPLMYGPTADGGHKVMRWFLSLTGRIPKEI